MSQDAVSEAYTQMTNPTLAWPESLRAPILIKCGSADNYIALTGHVNLSEEDTFLSFRRKIRAAWPSRAIQSYWSEPTTTLTINETGQAAELEIDANTWNLIKNTILLLWHDKEPGAAKWRLTSHIERPPPSYEDSQMEQALLSRAKRLRGEQDGSSAREQRAAGEEPKGRLRRRDRFRKWLRNQMKTTEWDHWRGEFVIPIY